MSRRQRGEWQLAKSVTKSFANGPRLDGRFNCMNFLATSLIAGIIGCAGLWAAGIIAEQCDHFERRRKQPFQERTWRATGAILLRSNAATTACFESYRDKLGNFASWRRWRWSNLHAPTSKKMAHFPLDILCKRSVSGGHGKPRLIGSDRLLSPRQRPRASAGSWWCGAMMRRHQERS